MKVQIELELNISAKAVYRNGEVGVSLTGTMPLVPGQDRQVSASVDTGFSEKVLTLFQKAFEAAISEKQDQLIRVTQVSTSEALVVATRRGEL